MTCEQNVDLTPFNTLALPGKASRYQKIATLGQLTATSLVQEKRFILGGGSNLVLTGDFDGLVLHMAIPGKRLLKEDSAAFYIEAGAGENWHDFVQWTVQQGWPGLENLSLIPGTVGAAPIQNIGAYGLELAERFHSLTAWDFEKQAFLTVDRAGCRFAYRDSLFKQEGWHLNGRLAISSVIFRLPKIWVANSGYADVATELAARKIATPTALEIAQPSSPSVGASCPTRHKHRMPAASSTIPWSTARSPSTWPPPTRNCRATRSRMAGSSWPPAG